MSIEARLRALAARWADVPAGESANFPPYITELTQVLEVEPPRPRGSGYEFEHPVKVVSRDGRESTNFIDLYKEGCFVLEAKHSAEEGASTEALLRRAYGQALSYANALPGGPPLYVLVLDVARTLLVWDRWNGDHGGSTWCTTFRRLEMDAAASCHHLPPFRTMTISLVLHPDARRNFDEKATALLSELITYRYPTDEPVQQSYSPDVVPAHVFQPEAYALPEVTTLTDGEGAVLGRCFDFQGAITGLHSEGYERLRKLAEQIQRVPAFRDTVSVRTIEDGVFEWIRKRICESYDESMTDYLLRDCEQKISVYEVVLPLFGVHLESAVNIGKVTIRELTATDFENWFGALANSLAADEQVFFESERQKHQGYAAALLKLHGEPRRVTEIALHEAETAVAMLRLFSGFMLSPGARSYCTLYGKQNMQSTKHLLIKEGTCVTIAEGMVSNAEWRWSLDAARVEQIRRNGLDTLSRLLRERRTPFQEDLVSALLLYSRSSLRDDPVDKLVYILVALETMLLQNDSEPIQDNIATRLAFTIGRTREERKSIVASVKGAYGLRSRFVHHGHPIQRDESLGVLRQFMQHTWMFFLTLIRSADKFEDRQKFISALEDRKLT